MDTLSPAPFSPSHLDLTVLFGGIITMLILAVALVVFFVLYQRRLFAQQARIIEQDRTQQRALLSAAVEVQESERRRIASDLHDDIGSLLSAARLYLKQLTVDQPENKEIKTETLDIVSRIIRNTRRITHDLMPAELEKFGLSAAVEDLCTRVDRAGEITVGYRSDLSRRLKPKCEIALYRVVQELVNNTLKHAEATRIEVEMTTQGERFLLRYADNGKGFEIDNLNSRGGSGLGLRNIESRVSLIDGTLDYNTAPGEGLKLHIYLPLAPSLSLAPSINT